RDQFTKRQGASTDGYSRRQKAQRDHRIREREAGSDIAPLADRRLAHQFSGTGPDLSRRQAVYAVEWNVSGRGVAWVCAATSRREASPSESCGHLEQVHREVPSPEHVTDLCGDSRAARRAARLFFPSVCLGGPLPECGRGRLLYALAVLGRYRAGLW